MSTDILETRTEIDSRGLVSDKALAGLSDDTCTFMLDLMRRVATDSEYVPYGTKGKKCSKCDGHDTKCKGYMLRTSGLEIVNELKEIYG